MSPLLLGQKKRDSYRNLKSCDIKKHTQNLSILVIIPLPTA